MNKELKALERFKKGIDKDFNLLKEALKRNEPMKVDLETDVYFSDGYYYFCPKCGEPLIERWHNYCPDCGQKLDWSEENEKN